jgi:hypothetical protein
MSRDLNADLAATLDADVLYPAILLDLQFISGTLFLWSGNGNRVWNGNTYTGAGGILNISAIQESGEVQSTGITITLAGLDPAATSIALQEVAQNKPGVVRFGLLDAPDGNWIGAPAVAFAGPLDLVKIKEDPAGTTVAINYESRLANLEVPRLWSWTDQDQQASYPDDLGFQFVGTIADQILQWGG